MTDSSNYSKVLTDNRNSQGWKPSPSYWITRFVLLRLLGLVYFAAFFSAAMQIVPLIGRQGLFPAQLFLGQLETYFGSRLDGFLQVPTLFWLNISDSALLAVSWTGVGLSLLVLLGYWLLWFAAMSSADRYPWSVHLVWKLLTDDQTVLGLLAKNPFPDGPPRFVRVRLYRYRFAPPTESAWWQRSEEGMWLPPFSADDPRLLAFLRS